MAEGERERRGQADNEVRSQEARDDEREARRVRLDHLLGVYTVGSGVWSWDVEYRKLINRPVTQRLLLDVEENGIREPILLGGDGRVWDGHHRITVAMHLGLDLVPVEFAAGVRKHPEPEHGPDWSDWGIDHPDEPPSCRCGYNGTPEECAASREHPLVAEVRNGDFEDRAWMIDVIDRLVAAGHRKHPEPEITGSASQRVTEVLGTDDWVIVHSGNGLVTDVELDGMEVQR